MEKIIVNPLSVRGLGDIVSPKILADFDVCDGVLASSTDTVNGVSMTVFTTSYRSGSRLLKSGDGFIVYTPDLTSMSVNVLLKTKSGSVISSASVSCIVDNETTLTATTNSSGEASFNIPFVEGESYYSLRFVYAGTNSVAGCSIYGRIFVGVPEELTLQGSDDLITVDETSRLTATLTGVDVSDERVPIPLATVDIYECMGYYRLLDKIVVPCESTGTNYCDSIGLDTLDWDLNDCNWAIEFDFINTANGGRLCIGDSNSWSSGSGAGDNYLYCGTSTAGNGGYGTKRTGNTDNSSAGAVTAGDTLHYRIVKTGTTISYYLNGTLKGSKTASWITTVDEWSIYLQLWNNGETTIKNLSLDLSPKIRVSPGIVASGDTESLTVTLVDPVDGSRVVGETVSVYVDDSHPGITLVSNKQVLSYSDGDSCTLTATVLDGDDEPLVGETVSMKAYQGSTLLDTLIVTDNEDGTYTATYDSAGVGDVSIVAECRNLQETYVIEDCYAYATSPSTWSSMANKGTTYHFSPFTMPTNHKIQFKLKATTNGIKIGCGDTTHTNASGYLEWIYAWYNSTLYYRTSTNSETSTSVSVSANTSTIYTVEYNGTSLKLYADNNQLKSITTYDILGLTRLLRLNGDSVNNFDWIKVKPL